MSRSIWTFLSIVVISALILALIFVPTAQPNRRGAILIISRSAEQAQTEAPAPPGGWLIVRRIPRPE